MADDKKTASRRDFLKLAGTGVPAAAAAVALSGSATMAAADEVPSALGLQKTAHVKAYLQAARF